MDEMRARIKVYTVSKLKAYTDIQELLLIDPIHNTKEVGGAGVAEGV